MKRSPKPPASSNSIGRPVTATVEGEPLLISGCGRCQQPITPEMKIDAQIREDVDYFYGIEQTTMSGLPQFVGITLISGARFRGLKGSLRDVFVEAHDVRRVVRQDLRFHDGL
jgi:hypothetical protein